MTTMLAIFRRPEGSTDAEAIFERRYAEEHLPLIAATPGLRGVRVRRVTQSLLGDRDLFLVTAMDFDDTDAPLATSRIDAIVKGGRPLLSGVDWDDRQDEWVGPRPVTIDGLPLIGATNVPRVFVNGGHGMWGITLGPLSGKLLAEQIVTGQVPPELLPMSPTR